MASHVTVKTKPHAYPREAVVRVGILETGKEHEGGMTVGELAEIHEFGLGGVPARAPIRVFFDERSEKIVQLATAEFEKATQGRGDLRSFEIAAERIAWKAAAEIRNRITEKLAPDITENTKKRKLKRGFQPPYTPLVETGVLRNSYVGDAEVKP